jgi:hypothetical protein
MRKSVPVFDATEKMCPDPQKYKPPIVDGLWGGVPPSWILKHVSPLKKVFLGRLVPAIYLI